MSTNEHSEVGDADRSSNHFARVFLEKGSAVLAQLDTEKIEQAAKLLRALKDKNGRLFIAGSGGGAGHASHATCDFRKLCNIEAYAPYDNIPELTARINDDGWQNTLTDWLAVSRFSANDCLLIFSVGGGDMEKNISGNLANAVKHAKEIGAKIIGIVGKNGGATAKAADVAILIPQVDENLVTPLTESIQSLVWHLLASHPLLQTRKAKWESTKEDALEQRLR